MGYRARAEQGIGLGLRSGVAIASWGNHGALFGRKRAVRAIAAAAGLELRALRVTGAGQPEHLLYLTNGLTPEPFQAPLARPGPGGVAA